VDRHARVGSRGAVAKAGTRFEVEICGERVPAEVVKLPFWIKGSARKGK
jgi:glycine cleavage system aminomethyltransferase T